MKYLLLGLFLIALLLGGGLLALWQTARALDETEAPLRAMEDPLRSGDYEALLALTEESRALWEERYGFFASIFSHADLEDVDQSYASLAAYAEQEELAEFRDAYRRLWDLLEHLRRMDIPYYYNILAFLTDK